MKTLKISFPFSDHQAIERKLKEDISVETYRQGALGVTPQSTMHFYTDKGVITLGPEVLKQAVIEIS